MIQLLATVVAAMGVIAAPQAYRSPNAIVLSPNGARAYVVNQTSGSVSVLDVRGRKVIDEFSVGDHPAHASITSDGRTLLVSSLYENSVAAVDIATKKVMWTTQVGLEPYGTALSADDTKLVVANSISDSVSVIDTASGDRLFDLPTSKNPRYVVAVPKSDRFAVSDGLGRSVTIIDVAGQKVVERRPLGRASILREIGASRDGRYLFVAHLLSHDEHITFQMERGWIHSNGFSVVDLARPEHRVTLLLDQLTNGAGNPWGLAQSDDGSRLFVTLAGVHELAIVRLAGVFELVASVETPAAVKAMEENVEILHQEKIATRHDVGGLGPRGLVFVAGTNEVLVANYFSDSVSVIDGETGQVRAVIELGPKVEMTAWRKGHLLINDARLCYQHWFSCASCHQEDATVDALNWDLSNDGIGNPKSAKSLHDVHETPPAMWGGVRANMDAAVQAGQRFLGFLPEPENHAALLAFLSAPPRAPNPYLNQDPATLERGKRLFREASCETCHPPPTYTDQKRHDLGLAAPTDLRSRFDTPSLRDCYRTGPFLHDGRAETLEETFSRHNGKDLHGTTSGLSPEEMADLLAYVRTL